MLSHQRPWFRAILCLLAIGILSGCMPQRRPVQQPPPAAPTPTVRAEESWNAFLDDVRTRCKPEEGCTIDYERLREYDGRHFGITVIGYKDSEYFVDLHRFDSGSNEWIGSPRVQPEDGYEHIDVPATSEQWDVPEATVRGWIDEAERTVREIYSKRQ